ncbi:MAG TPA: hypothetical protein PL155_03530 [Candidatus Omnitrophota bacterium]|nr:hypothetical protein [Candidatus Omnitrophota bacterium]HPD84450.1 hypothetical protein [Candidatus Omnitrophota bacterium]HRZ03308.1 hypothetical protein [Candidatus Omnitrophota bacterium]
METKTMTRRDFLKTTGIFMAGLFLFRIKDFLNLMSAKKNNFPPSRLVEARHYTRADHLAG